METKEARSIDNVIKACETKIEEHRNAAGRILNVLFLVTAIFVLIVISNIVIKKLGMNNAVKYSKEYVIPIKELTTSINSHIYNQNMDSAQLNGLVRTTVGKIVDVENKFYDSSFEIDKAATYIGYGIFILIFGVLTSFYRYRIKEVSKYEHFLFGFHRIRIAGNNSELGFNDEVRTSLTKDAFATEHSKPLISKTSKVESPLPGHITSDTLTIVLNKLLEGVDITLKKKP